MVGTDGHLLTLARHLSTTARRGPEYDHDMVGFNYRMTNLQAAVGCAQLERLDDFLAAKRRIRARYDDAFSAQSGLSPFPGGGTGDNACWLSGVVTADAASAVRLRRHLNDAGVEAKPFWKPLHLQSPYREALRNPQPVSEELWQRVVPLPSSTHLSEVDQERVISVARQVNV